MFIDCINLLEVNIPSNVKIIDWRAFRNCDSITKIEIPSSVETIEDEAFGRMAGLRYVYIPSSVKKVGKDVFEGSPDLVIHCEDPTKKKGWSTQFARYVLNPIQWGSEK